MVVQADERIQIRASEGRVSEVEVLAGGAGVRTPITQDLDTCPRTDAPTTTNTATTTSTTPPQGSGRYTLICEEPYSREDGTPIVTATVRAIDAWKASCTT